MNNEHRILMKRIRKAVIVYFLYGAAFSVICILTGLVTSVSSFLYTLVLWIPVMITAYPYDSGTGSIWIYIFLALFAIMEVQIIRKGQV